MTEECKERGELMADVWIAYTTVLETVMTRMHQLCLEDRDRLATADVQQLTQLSSFTSLICHMPC